MSDLSVIRDWERRWLNPDDDDEDEIDEEYIWNKADDEGEEIWLERRNRV